jgi:hypothetical protein
MAWLRVRHVTTATPEKMRAEASHVRELHFSPRIRGARANAIRG